MRYRKLDADGDMTIGADAFHVDSPEGVAQAIRTRLGLYLGEWFLNVDEGTDWNVQVLGRYTDQTRDPVIRERVLGTQGVNAFLEYGSNLDRETRQFTVAMTVDTIYGPVSLTEPL